MTRTLLFAKANVTVVCSVLALAIALAAGGYVLAGGTNGPSGTSIGTIDVQGSAQQKGSPDTLSLQLSVNTTAASAGTALNRNNSEMTHLQSILRKNGVAPADLQTNGLNVGPTYNDQGKINGYSAEDDLSVTFHDIAHSGAVIDAAQNAVGNDVEINSINFSLSKNSALLQRAAFSPCSKHTEAADFARGAGGSVGSVEKITQNQTTSPPPVLPVFNAAAGAAKSVPVPLRPGTQSVSVQVDVVYRLIG